MTFKKTVACLCLLINTQVFSETIWFHLKHVSTKQSAPDVFLIVYGQKGTTHMVGNYYKLIPLEVKIKYYTHSTIVAPTPSGRYDFYFSCYRVHQHDLDEESQIIHQTYDVLPNSKPIYVQASCPLVDGHVVSPTNIQFGLSPG
jgi:hypothetical protein